MHADGGEEQMRVTEPPVTGAGLLSEGRSLNQTLATHRHRGPNQSEQNLHPRAPHSKWLLIAENLLGNVEVSFRL